MTSLRRAVSIGFSVLSRCASRSLTTARALSCAAFTISLQSPAYPGLQQGTGTITAGQPSDDATDVMALLVNMKSYQVNITIKKTYTPAKKAEEIAAAIDAAKIPGVKTAVNNNVVTITGATKFVYADNSQETGLKLASAGPAANDGVIVTLGYTGEPSEDDATYVAAFGDSAFTDTASITFPTPPALDTLLEDVYADLKTKLPAGPQSRLVLDLPGDAIEFIFPSSSDQFVQNYTSDSEVTANLSIQGVPEPSTWAMALLGFAGLAYAGYRRGRPAVAAT